MNLNEAPFTPDKSENIIMVEDFILPNIDWFGCLPQIQLDNIFNTKQIFRFVYNKGIMYGYKTRY